VNCAPYDLTLHGASRLNQRIKTMPQVVYGSVIGMGSGWVPSADDDGLLEDEHASITEEDRKSSADADDDAASTSTASVDEPCLEEDEEEEAVSDEGDRPSAPVAPASRLRRLAQAVTPGLPRTISQASAAVSSAVPALDSRGSIVERCGVCFSPTAAVDNAFWFLVGALLLLQQPRLLIGLIKSAALALVTWATKWLHWDDADFVLSVPGFSSQRWLQGGHDGLAGELTQTAPLQYDKFRLPAAAPTKLGFPSASDRDVCAGVWHTLRVGADHLGIVPSPSDGALSQRVLLRVRDLQQAAEARLLKHGRTDPKLVS
jgi:hypothetical protein